VGEYKTRTGFDVFEIFGEVIERFVGCGMLLHDESEERVYLSRKALGVADSVICEFASF